MKKNLRRSCIVELYFPPKPNSPLFLGAAAGAATFLPATALAAGLATTLATGFAATLATTFAAGFATTFPFAGAAAGLTSAFLPKALNGLAFFTGAGGVAGAATFFAPPPNIASKGDGGILEPGQLKEGIAWMAVYEIGATLNFKQLFMAKLSCSVERCVCGMLQFIWYLSADFTSLRSEPHCDCDDGEEND